MLLWPRSCISDFEHRAVIVEPAVIRRSKQIPRRVHEQAAGWARAIRAVERRQHDRRVVVTRRRLGDLKDCAVAAGTAVRGRPIEIARGIGDEGPFGICPVGEVERHQRDRRTVVAGRRLGDLEDGAVAVGAAIHGRPVEIARGVGQETCRGMRSVGPVECRQHNRRAIVARCCVGDLENRSVEMRAAV